jgi:hypothetical protein
MPRTDANQIDLLGAKYPVPRDNRPDPREETPGDIDDREHLDFLTRMVTENVVPANVAQDARSVWGLARASANGQLPIPAASAREGVPVHYTWDCGDLHLEAEIPGGGPVEWFFRDWKTGELWSAELAASDPPPPPLARIFDRLVSASQPN